MTLDKGAMGGEKLIIVAEKASVARAIKAVVAAAKANAVVSSVRGHMMEADLPDGYEWGAKHPLEIIKLRKVVDKISDNRVFEQLVKVFSGGGSLVIATDNDSEGELIGYEILQVYRRVRGGEPVVFRMRFNSVDRRELFASLRNLEKGLNMRWVEKARFRQIFDLVTGAAFTRLLTLSTRRLAPVRVISWGSCQTPTLNFVVEREKEIQRFKPQKYWVLEATLRTAGGEEFKAATQQIWSREKAEQAFEKARKAGEAVVTAYSKAEKTLQRPLPMRTDDVLRDLTRITGVSANRLLAMMEELYAEGYISYPRTDTNRYRRGFDFQTPLNAVTAADALRDAKPDKSEPVPRNGSRDDGAHPPIYPVATYRGTGVLMQIWEYIARRFYANAFFDDAVQSTSRAEIDIDELTFSAEGSTTTKQGYLQVFTYFRPRDKPLPELMVGEKLQIIDVAIREDETKPPPRLTEADLLKLMEKNGIGTDATRASFPQLITERNYAVRVGRVFKPTPLGMALIEALAEADTRLVTPETRRLVEDYMAKIERGETGFEESLEQSLRLYEELLKRCSDKIDEISSSLAQHIKPVARKKAAKKKHDGFTNLNK
ncbi:MAG: DNA topoisomerase [Candidatus Caldarchaeum sp.]